jgi:hypothetical protein
LEFRLGSSKRDTTGWLTLFPRVRIVFHRKRGLISVQNSGRKSSSKFYFNRSAPKVRFCSLRHRVWLLNAGLSYDAWRAGIGGERSFRRTAAASFQYRWLARAHFGQSFLEHFHKAVDIMNLSLDDTDNISAGRRLTQVRPPVRKRAHPPFRSSAWTQDFQPRYETRLGVWEHTCPACRFNELRYAHVQRPQTRASS